jgi:heat shock protein HslJ
MEPPQPNHVADPPGPPPPLEGTEWRLSEYPGSEGALLQVAEGILATATFAGGTVAGTTGCNRFRAGYRLEADRLAVEAAMMTMMACEPDRTAVERAFMAALAAVAAFAVAGDTLGLVDADGRVLLRFRAAAPLPLVGTRWVASAINNGRGGVAGALAGVEVSATFGDDGRVAGSGGCNRFGGPFVLDGSGLSIGILATTRMACSEPEGVGEQEAAFLAALGRADTWSIREGRLHVRDGGGALQVEFRPAPAE